MVLSIVDHDQAIVLPVPIYLIEMFNQLDKEQNKCVAICLSLVHSVEEFTTITYGSYRIDAIESTVLSYHVVFASVHPTSLSMISDSNDTLINIDDP